MPSFERNADSDGSDGSYRQNQTRFIHYRSYGRHLAQSVMLGPGFHAA